MALKVEDILDESKYRQILRLPYDEIVPFVFGQIRIKTDLMVFFWSVCIVFLGFALHFRLAIAGYFQFKEIILHTILGLIALPLVSIPVHELLHIIPFLFTGARKIKIGADFRQYFFYVTVHRHVITTKQFWFVGLTPFLVMNILVIILVIILPGQWKWSLSLLLFVHTTMCAGDFALLNFYRLNRGKKIYTWDDADEKMAYFYEEI
jgi:hypothetical protein